MAYEYDEKYPIFKMRIGRDLQSWLKTFAQRHGVSMASVVKAQLEELKRKEERAKQREVKA